MSKIKTYRGLLTDGAQQKINLKTNTGKIGYRIVKFQIMPDDPNQSTVKHVVKIFSVPQTTIDDSVDFSDNTLLGASFYNEQPAPGDQAGYGTVVFDNITFNQDIYVTNVEPSNNQPVNYFIELEQVKLNDNESTMATLQSIRSKYESYTPAGPT